MNRVGILTRHCYPNYGSLLQAIALQQALARAGADVHVVDYVPPSDGRFGLARSSLRESRMRESWIGSAAYLAIQGPNFAVMASRFRRFQKANLRLTHMVGDGADLPAVARDLDRIIVGSDQVWNVVHGTLDETYFLSQLDDSRKKYSYAGSFGSSAPVDDIAVKRMLADFRAVSVREPSAAEHLKALGLDVRRDVDPVLLHGREFWYEFSARVRVAARSPYLLVYQLHNTPHFDARVEELSRRSGLPVRRVNVDIKRLKGFPYRSHYLASPQEFVALFRDAAAVITDSFHGLSFSLIFGRTVYPVLPNKGAARLTDLLDAVDLRHLAVSADQMDLPTSGEYEAQDVARCLSTLAAESWRYIEGLAT
ncbi:polysaccharide pyruvyl transferase family protein [Gordonia aurantiaca]|uniref:polysaccharide pyruvyl transferase family protein n=1 Tax=Gordonia sp. B21 TaxID=3151852 RepID=UPI0032636D4D